MKSGTKICIIGMGRFGTLMASILKNHFEVSVIDTNFKEALKKAKKIGIKTTEIKELGNFDVVILSVPISQTLGMIKNIAPYLKKGSMLLDTCSVKTLPYQWMKKHIPKNVEILGTHPMFGPVTTKFNFEKQFWNLENLQIVLCPVRINSKSLKMISKFLKSLRLKVIKATSKDHDKQNAKTLALVHFLGRALMASDIKKQEIFTPRYIDLLNIIEHTASDNWQLFFDMNNFNPFSQKIREKFLESCNDLDLKIADSQGKNSLNSQRNIIDVIDRKIFKLLKKRFEAVGKIGRIKNQTGKIVYDEKREKDIIKNKVKKLIMDDELVKDIYQAIFSHSHKIQNDIIKKNSKN